MKNMDVALRKSIFSRMVATFLLIIIPVYALSINVYSWGINTLKLEMLGSMKSQADYYIRSLDAEIQRIKMLQYDCMNDEDLNRLATIPEALGLIERTQRINKLQKRLFTIKNSSAYITDVTTYIPGIKKSISAEEGYTDIPKDIPGLRDKWNNYYDTGIMLQNNRIFMSAAYHSSPGYPDKSIPLFVIEIELAPKAFQEAMQLFNDYEGSGSVLFNEMSFLLNTPTDENKKLVDVLMKSENYQKKNDTGTVKFGNRTYLAIRTSSKILGLTLIKYIPESEVFKPLFRYYLWFYAFAITALVIIVLYSLSTHRLIHKPLLILVKSFRRVEDGELDVIIDHKYDDEFRYLYRRFNAMVQKLNTLIEQVYKQKILAQNAELKQLQSQINPHFLYNSFFILHRTIKGGQYENAVHFSQKLGNYFKFITRNDSDEVELAEEINHARIYTEIQAMRFSNRVKVHFGDFPDRLAGLKVPRLILQPLLENAFEHGLKTKVRDGILSVKFHLFSGDFFTMVEDNGDEICSREIERLTYLLDNIGPEIENTGIVNIHKRIRLKFGNGSGINFSRSEYGGLKVIMRICLKGSDNDEQAFDR